MNRDVTMAGVKICTLLNSWRFRGHSEGRPGLLCCYCCCLAQPTLIPEMETSVMNRWRLDEVSSRM